MSSSVCEPADLAEAAAVLADGGRIALRGAGTATGWAAPVSTVDTTVETGRLTGVVAYEPADLTVVVRAGTALTDLQATLAECGQWVALDPARQSRGATVGGLLATADAGPRVHRFGPLRDQVLGVTVVLVDGSVVHSGGRVIKNVAGYDLAKLFSGSFGTLGLIAEVVLRTQPQPAESVTLSASAEAAAAAELAAAVAARPVEPTAVCWTTAEAGRLLVRLDGAHTAEAATELAAVGLAVLDPAAAAASWAAEARLVAGGGTVVRIGALPSRFLQLSTVVSEAAAEHGVDVDWSSYLGVGVHTLALRGEWAGEVVAAVRQRFADAALTVRQRDGAIPGWGPPPAAVSVLRAVKHAFDPDGRLEPGRFFPWLER